MRLYLGIDFGTTTCSANGYVAMDDSQDSQFFSIPLGEDKGDVMPSVAAFWNGEYHVGYDALKNEIPRSSVIFSSKRLLGRRPFCIDDYPEVKYQLYNMQPVLSGYQYVVNDNTNKEKYLDVDEVAYEILKVIYEKAETELKKKIDSMKEKKMLGESINPKYDVVAISVPSMFHYQSCNLLRRAAVRAGMSRVQLVSEPVSAGFSYLREKREDGYYLVYDMGGGTFDTTIIQSEKGSFTTIGKSGLENCGGDNIDLIVYELVINEREDLEHLRWDGKRVFTNDMLMLLDACREAKENLKANDTLEVSLNCLGITGNNSTVSIPRDVFTAEIGNLVTKTITVCKDLVSNVLKDKKLDGVILIGGSSNLAYVEQRVKNAFIDLEVYDDYKDKYVVSRGAVRAATMMKEDVSFENQPKPDTTGVVNGSSNIIGSGLRPMIKELCDCTEATIFIVTNSGRKELLPAYTSYGEERGSVSLVVEKNDLQSFSQPLPIYRDYGDNERERIGNIPLNRGRWKEKDCITVSAMMDSDRFLHVYLRRSSSETDDNGDEEEIVIA